MTATALTPKPRTAVHRAAPTTAFVFPGQGSQWAGMGLDLRAKRPAFAQQLEACDAALRPHTGWSVIDALAGRDLHRAEVVQPALWSVMVSLAAAWEAAGIHPDVVVGHSQGEIAAACVAGALSVEDAARVVALRSAEVARLSPSDGAMACVGLSEERARTLIRTWGERLSIAVVNSARTVVVAGDADAVTALCECCRADRIRHKQIQVDYASHTEQVEPVEARLLAALEPLRPGPLRVRMRSTVTEDDVTGAELDAGYFYRNLRLPVRFGPVVSALAAEGVTRFIEVSPHPVLVPAMRETLPPHAWAFGTLYKDQPGPQRFVRALNDAWYPDTPVAQHIAA